MAALPFYLLELIFMNRNTLYIVIAVLAVGVAVIGFQLYQERQKTTGIDITVGEGGISIKKK